MKYLYTILVIAMATILLLVLMPSPVDSIAYNPPALRPLTGPLAANDKLKQAEYLAKGSIYGPEDIAVDDKGRIYGGTQDGKIVRIEEDGRVDVFAETGGRPLGLHFDADGNLIVCDAWKGLLSVDTQGHITTLVTEAAGIPLTFTNDLDISSQGVIYFTDSSNKFRRNEFRLELLEARPRGRFLSYDPRTQETRVLMGDLYFANGVALSRNEDFAVINETNHYRSIKYWLKGEKAGSREIFADNLPGYPDGIAADRQGTFWLAIPAPRNAALDALHPWPFLKNLWAKFPQSILPKPQAYGLVLALNEEGDIIRSLHDSDGGHIREVSSVQPNGDYLYLGNIYQDWIGRVKVM